MTVTTARIVGLDTAGIRTLRAQADGTDDRLPHVVPVAPDLGVILADDDGSVLTTSALAEMGWTDEDVLRAAVAAAQEQAGGDVAVIQPGTIVIQDPDLAVVLVLAPQTFQGIELRGSAVVFPVAPTTFIVTGDQDEDGLRVAAGVAQQILADDEGEVLSGPPMVLRADGWVRFEHPSLDGELRTIRALWTSTVANLQQDDLQASFDRRGEEVHVAAVSVARLAEDSPAFSYSSWTQDVETIVAAVDTVVLVTLDGQTQPVPFGRLRELATDLIDELDVRPARYRLRGFPELGAIRAAL
ncbi:MULTISPECIES: hypothetical protein [unclassified Curtobacterium]|uniref:hypothetical protein n=1 Tax=unclassified Curtobacterium TaxID=257496 RepID=UPI000F479926|nr:MULTISPECIES: hypothetical protein [unclassified Curtobacterium]ROQ17304.1 hypothetical protein EDF41_0336 [Curtobacterium sp. PhB171]ROQ29451.1 hypothetical protein EDF40_0688 [Curtobacterium sp. PhB170]ROS45403.1 hypothetical protein EDF25_0160 [Curtobacterium sp. PhB131]ROS65889.1 hypothetical protein EDF30_3007 [Curtobacterium sp. PhB141]